MSQRFTFIGGGMIKGQNEKIMNRRFQEKSECRGEAAPKAISIGNHFYQHFQPENKDCWKL